MIEHDFTQDNLARELPADYMCGCAKGPLLGPCEHAAPDVIQVGNIVTILDGTTRYDVTETADDMARIWPRAEDDPRDGQWISVNLLRPVQ